ncbi:MAG: hypothetical protein DI527_00495 [Chelatococcus sp.]|nr:MAG: hypothetical protein DI527_00495 [Chelatococcus sp.]
MTTETKAFPTAEVISSIAGVLICDIGGVYRVLGWMTGEELFTHQLPRAGREATPVAVAFDPRLAEVVKEAEQVNETNWQEWRDRWIERFGQEITVPRLTLAQHKEKNPIAELREMAPQAEIIPVVVGEELGDGA